MKETNYESIKTELGNEIKAWVKGVPFEDKAKLQAINVADMPFIYKWVALMPDVHAGMGATIGSVIPTVWAIIPSAVGVDIGCGMIAQKLTLKGSELEGRHKEIREMIEKKVPHGRNINSRRGKRDAGSWGKCPDFVETEWQKLEQDFKIILRKYPMFLKTNNKEHLGTLGTGNHFIEVCIDSEDSVWLMLHSGSRGVGNAIGNHFIKLAKEKAKEKGLELADMDLAYFEEGEELFNDYLFAAGWAQRFASINREIMMRRTIESLQKVEGIPTFETEGKAINCHHNYVNKENHFDNDVYVTRKGAVSAQAGELGIIPGSMGAKSYIVRGLGNRDSFCSCSHGAGRLMSRTEAQNRFTVEDHIAATEGVECKKTAAVIDETPMAYKSIDDVMEAQKDLVEIVTTIKQVICIKG